jgi:hypothetical protein
MVNRLAEAEAAFVTSKLQTDEANRRCIEAQNEVLKERFAKGAAESTSNMLHEQVTSERAKAAELLLALNSAEDKARQLQDELLTIKSTHTNVDDDAEKSSLQMQLSDSRREIQHLTEQNAAIKEQLQLQQQLLQQQVESLEALEEMDLLRDEVDRVKEELRSAQHTATAYKEEADSLSIKNQTAEKEAQLKLDKLKMDTEAAVAEREAAQQLTLQLKTQLEALRLSIVDLEIKAQRLESEAAAIADVQRANAAQESEAAVTQISQEITTLKLQLELANQELIIARNKEVEAAERRGEDRIEGEGGGVRFDTAATTPCFDSKTASSNPATSQAPYFTTPHLDRYATPVGKPPLADVDTVAKLTPVARQTSYSLKQFHFASNRGAVASGDDGKEGEQQEVELPIVYLEMGAYETRMGVWNKTTEKFDLR